MALDSSWFGDNSFAVVAFIILFKLFVAADLAGI